MALFADSTSGTAGSSLQHASPSCGQQQRQRTGIVATPAPTLRAVFLPLRLLRSVFTSRPRSSRYAPLWTCPAVEATAVAYFKRVYLRANLLDRGLLRPQHAALACIYLAAKVEEELSRITLGALARRGGITQDVIIRSELAVLEALSFQVTVFHPFRSLDALLSELLQTLVWGTKLRRPTKRRKPPTPCGRDAGQDAIVQVQRRCFARTLSWVDSCDGDRCSCSSGLSLPT